MKFEWKGLLTGLAVALIYTMFASFQLGNLNIEIIFIISSLAVGGIIGLVFDLAVKNNWRVIPVGMLTPVIYNVIAMLQGSEYSLYVFGENLLVGGFIGIIIYLIFRFRKW